MSTVPPNILDRVKRARALSKSAGNANEAAAAAALVEKLIAEHGIEEAMLEAEPGQDEVLASHDPLEVMNARGFVHWKSYLLSNLCDLHGCAHCYDVDGGKRKAIFFGRRSDVDVVKELYGWLTGEITRLAKKEGRGRRKEWTESYRLGCVVGISDAMLHAQNKARKDAPSTALALIDSRLVEAQRLRDQVADGAERVKTHKDEDTDEDAFERGRLDGWSAQRNGPQSKGAPRLSHKNPARTG